MKRMRLTGMLMLIAGFYAAGARAADPAALQRDANAALRAGQSAFFAGRHDDAMAQVEKAEALIVEWTSAAPNDPALKSAGDRAAKLRRDVEARRPKTPAPADPAAAPAPPPAPPGAAKLPAGAAYRLREAQRALDGAERALASPTAAADWRVGAAKAGVETARAKLAEIEQTFGAQAPADHPDLAAVRARIAVIERGAGGAADAAAAAGAQAADARAASDAWEARFAPFVYGPGRAGHDPDRWLGGVPRDVAALAKALSIRAAAAALLAEYDRAPAAAPTDTLSALVRDLRHAIGQFDDSHREFIRETIAQAEEQARQMETFLAAQEQKPAGEPILWIEAERIADLDRRAGLAAELVGAEHAGVATLRGRARAIAERNAALRKARVAQTRMRPDRYAGRDAAELRRKAGEVAAKAAPGGRILRTTLPREDWREESAVEWTDTTRTALRHRVTRELIAEVAVREGAAARLLTIWLGQDRRSDGAWGELKGHVMYSDGILPEHVEK